MDNIKFKDNQIILFGKLNFFSVPEVIKQAQKFILNKQNSDAVVHVDLSQIEHGNSAGISLLIELNRLCTSVNKRLSLSGMPKQMQTISQVYGVDLIFQTLVSD